MSTNIYTFYCDGSDDAPAGFFIFLLEEPPVARLIRAMRDSYDRGRLYRLTTSEKRAAVIVESYEFDNGCAYLESVGDGELALMDTLLIDIEVLPKEQEPAAGDEFDDEVYYSSYANEPNLLVRPVGGKPYTVIRHKLRDYCVGN